MSSGQTSASELDSGVHPKSLREQIALLLTDSPVESNYEAMCAEIATRRGMIRDECPDCSGLGFKAHTAPEIVRFKTLIANKEHAGAKHTSISAERERFGLESTCKACKGRGWVPQIPDTGEGIPDSLYTTVQCERCTGFLKTTFGRHRGTSCGEQFPPTDKSAEREDKCPACLGDMYQVPITARPVRGSGFLYGSVAEEDEKPRRFGQESRLIPVALLEADRASAALEQLRAESPEVALATTILLGEHGDTWGLHVWGRRFSIWPLTNAGIRLFEESGAESGEDDPYTRRLDVLAKERGAELSGPSRERRRALIALADEQARSLETRVDRALDGLEMAS